MKAGYITAILSGLLVLAAACGGDDDDGLPQDQIQELQRIAAELTDQAGFHVITPSYLPSNLRFPPTQAEVATDQDGTPTDDVIICFSSRPEQRGQSSPLLNGLCIIEQRSGLGAVSCPPQVRLEGEDQILLSRGVTGVEQMPQELGFHDLRFCADETFVILKLDWVVGDRTGEVDEHMRSEGRKIAESVIERAEEP